MNEENFISIQDLSDRTKLPVSWWYSQTRLTGPDAVPRRKTGKYLRFLWSEVKPWLDKSYGVNAGGEA